ncbi:MAG: PIN domain-containing protein [Bryobacterales bacterium]|nr:PIN domain-containing protein [Bryobacterales bacterium]
MMSGGRVFIDTGIYIALLNKRDQYHRQALSLFGGPRPNWHTSILVWSEAYSWFLHRHGENAARSFRTLTSSLEGLEILGTDLDHHRETLRLLDRLRGARLTYVDASSLALMERHKIRTAWSTDYHFGLTGARVVPGGII